MQLVRYSTIQLIFSDPNANISTEHLGEKIGFKEFLSFMTPLLHDPSTASELSEAFRVFDRNNNGHFKLEDLKKALTSMGNKLTEEEVSKFFIKLTKKFDLITKELLKVDDEGDVDYEELVQKLVKS